MPFLLKVFFLNEVYKSQLDFGLFVCDREMLQHHVQPMLVLLWETGVMFLVDDIWWVSKNSNI